MNADEREYKSLHIGVSLRSFAGSDPFWSEAKHRQVRTRSRLVSLGQKLVPQTRVNAMTVDVEDYFQVSAFEDHIRREDWGRWPWRVEPNMDRILGLFADKGVKATFFTLGWVAERYPGMVRRIVAEGHELASHGWSHVRATEQDRTALSADVTRTKKFLEDLSGTAVLGYRAASYSIGERNLWALEVLDEAGHRYSSSIVPIRHDLYGMPGAPRFAFHPHSDSQFLEIPVTTFEVGRRTLPCGGGGWFRLFPYALSRWALHRVNVRDGQPCIFYFHPWEIDPDQPRPSGVGAKSRFRHYLNLHRMEGRLGELLNDFCWGRMDEVFLGSAEVLPQRYLDSIVRDRCDVQDQQEREKR